MSVPDHDLATLRDVSGVGRDVLERRIALLCDALAAQARRTDEMGDTLTRAQARCTELLTENRALRSQLGATPSEPLVLDEDLAPRDGDRP